MYSTCIPSPQKGDTVLILAVRESRLAVVKEILAAKSKVDVNQINTVSNTNKLFIVWCMDYHLGRTDCSDGGKHNRSKRHCSKVTVTWRNCEYAGHCKSCPIYFVVELLILVTHVEWKYSSYRSFWSWIPNGRGRSDQSRCSC